MRVACSCNPLIGHFHPMLPLAGALRDAGHHVTFVSGRELEPAVRAEGFPFAAAGPEFGALVTEAMKRAPDAELVTPADQQRFGFEHLFSEARLSTTLADGRAVMQEIEPDLVLNEPADFVGPLVAALWGIPNATVGTALVLLPEWLACAARGVARHWTDCGLEAPADAGLYRHLYLNQWPEPLQRPSVHELPLVVDLRPVAFGSETKLPEDLAHLGRDRPLIYVTFGTMFGSAETLDPVLDGLDGLDDLDVLVTTGSEVDPDPIARRHAGVFVRRFVAQAPVLARCRLAITHGGAGSVIGPLSFGVPLVVVPAGADQEENAARVELAGVGRGIAPADLSPASVRSTVGHLLGDDATLVASRAVQRTIDAMHPPAAVVRILEALAAA